MSKLTVEQVARVCYEANRAYCLSHGDDSFGPWDEAPDWQRATVLNGVQFHRDNPIASPIDSHENWLREKEGNGWVYGPVKDPEKKEHPCMVPYHELPVEQRRKDSLFIAIVRALDGGH
jgi:hypothetical protein